MGEWVGGDEPWSVHDRPEAQKALLEARAKGWQFRKLSSGGFGNLICRPLEEGEEAGPPNTCFVPVYSTAGDKSGAETAKIIRRNTRRKCRHRSEQSVVADGQHDPVQTADGCLDKATRLLDAAKTLLARGDREAEILELIAESEVWAAEAEAALEDKISELDDELQRDLADARQLASESAVAADPGALIGVGERLADEAEAHLALAKGERAAACRRRLGSVRDQIVTLRCWLA